MKSKTRRACCRSLFVMKAMTAIILGAVSLGLLASEVVTRYRNGKFAILTQPHARILYLQSVYQQLAPPMPLSATMIQTQIWHGWSLPTELSSLDSVQIGLQANYLQIFKLDWVSRHPYSILSSPSASQAFNQTLLNGIANK